MPLLALETATNTCGAALLVDGSVVAEAHVHRPRVHARYLTPLVESVVERGDISMQELTAVAVSMGPGSYTGLRIGVSTAKGFAMATGAPLVGVPTLEALAATVLPYADEEDLICALLDARRDEVYAAAYRVRSAGLQEDKPSAVPPVSDKESAEQNGAGQSESLSHLHVHAAPDALRVSDLPEWLDAHGERVWLVGNGSEKSVEPLQTDHRVRVVSGAASRPSAGWVARCAARRLAHGHQHEPDTFEPMYLKAFQTG